MIKLSVVLATFNEEKNLERCLLSVKNLADEIIIVDGSSVDKTVEIGRQMGVTVIVTDNPPIFHINKQKAIDEAKGEWILQLDADEVITEELKKEIISVVGAGSEFNAFWISRKNFFLGRWLSKGGQYPDPVIRLFKKGNAYLPCKSVHEQIQVEGEVGSLEEPMLHFSAPSFSRYLTNSNRYTSLTAQELKDKRVKRNLANHCYYFFFKPFSVFFKIYIRHLGIVDGFPGFIFALFSSLHFPVSYLKYWELKK